MRKCGFVILITILFINILFIRNNFGLKYIKRV
jgi:hypothetical protein